MTMRHVAAGSFSASIAQDSGNLFLWGSGHFGEFLIPHRVKRIPGEVIQVCIGKNFAVALTAQG